MRNGKIIDQLIYKGDIGKWVNNAYANHIRLVWAGDLDNDLRLDLVYITQNHHECFEIRLAETTTTGKIVKEINVDEECW